MYNHTAELSAAGRYGIENSAEQKHSRAFKLPSDFIKLITEAKKYRRLKLCKPDLKNGRRFPLCLSIQYLGSPLFPLISGSRWTIGKTQLPRLSQNYLH